MPGTPGASTLRPAELLRELGLCRQDGRPPRVTERRLDELARRERVFEWVHMGTSGLPAGELARILRDTPRLCPPRTGHLGNWEDIVLGRAGTLDYNQVVCCRWKLGYPLIYDLNQTEDAQLRQGDWVYLPGSRVQRGVRTELPLFTWDGLRLTERSREQPLFVPYVLTPVEGSLVPLSRVHRESLGRLPGLPFRTYSDLLVGREPLVRQILLELVEEARRRPDPELALELVFDRVVSLDGTVRREPISLAGGGFRAGRAFYEDAAALVDAALIPVRAAAEPEGFVAGTAGLPWDAPLLSGLLSEVFIPLLDAHYSAGEVDRETMKRPCNPHLHWGAISMAGYPPRRHGYFEDHVRSLRKIYQVLLRNMSGLDPVYFVLLPTTPLMLLPASAHPTDAEVLEVLIHRVLRETEGLLASHRLPAEIDRIVAGWLAGEGRHLSPYFRNRFSSRGSVYNEVDLPEESGPLEPEGFRALALRQACMIIGSLKEALAAP